MGGFLIWHNYLAQLNNPFPTKLKVHLKTEHEFFPALLTNFINLLSVIHFFQESVSLDRSPFPPEVLNNSNLLFRAISIKI